MIHTDVAVVGAGPAGAAVALLMARRGFEVALFERDEIHRDKACGEFLNPGALRLLTRELEIPTRELEARGAVPVSNVELNVGSRAPVSIPILDREGEPAPGLSVRRRQVDALLVERAQLAGVRVLPRHNVRWLLVGENGTDGVGGIGPEGEPFRCRAPLVVACDGTHSVIARQLGLTIPIARLQRIGLVAHLEGRSSVRADAVRMFGSCSPCRGVAGYSDQLEESILSFVLPRQGARLLAGRRAAFVDEQIDCFPGLRCLVGDRRIVDSAAVPCFGHTLARPFDNGVLIVGDAARFTDPFTGEGVHHALEGAVIAAEVATVALRERSFGRSSLRPYGRLRRELDSRYRFSDVIQAVMHHSPLASRAVEHLSRHPWSAKRLIAAIADVLPSSSLLHPRVAFEAILP